MARKEIPLTDAAFRGGWSYQQAHRLMLLGQLEGRREGRSWVVTEESVNRLIRKRDEKNAAVAATA